MTLFNKLYDHYKRDFDLELVLRKTGTTYKEANAKVQKQDGEWF